MDANSWEQEPWDVILFDIVKRARKRALWKKIYVGGCCKSTTEDISRLGKRIESLK
jgi:homocysteine S-methyltransferase